MTVSSTLSLEGTRDFSKVASVQSEQDLPVHRQFVKDCLHHSLMELVVGLCIGTNLIVVIMETNCGADPLEEVVATECAGAQVYGNINSAILVFYIFELLARMYVHQWAFFTDSLAILDLVVVVVDVITFTISVISGQDVVPLLSLLRVARLLKLTRAMRLMMIFPELNIMLRGLIGALRAILFGMIMIGLFLVIFGVLAVNIVHPVNVELYKEGYWSDVIDCERCPRAFSSVEQSVLTFIQQIIAGDSWGFVTVPIIERAWWTGIFFVVVLVSVSMTIMNLILAVIVEKASEAKEETMQELANTKQADFLESSKELLQLCADIDVEGSGMVSYQQLAEKCRESEKLMEGLRALDVSEEDMNDVFVILDHDGTGKVNYNEFVLQLNKMQYHDSRTLLVFIKHYVVQIRKRLEETFKKSINETSSLKRHMEGTVSRTMTLANLNNADSLASLDKLTTVMESLGHGEAQIDFDSEIRKLQEADRQLVESLKELAARSAEVHDRLNAVVQAAKQGADAGKGTQGRIMTKPQKNQPKAVPGDSSLVMQDTSQGMSGATSADGCAQRAPGMAVDAVPAVGPNDGPQRQLLG